MTSLTLSALVKATFAILATSILWADSSTIWARRQVTTDPAERLTMPSTGGEGRAACRGTGRARMRTLGGPRSALCFFWRFARARPDHAPSLLRL